MPGLHLTLTELRGHATEAVHAVAAAVVDASGHAVLTVGEPCTTTWRSAAKPFQLEASLSLLPAELAASLDPRALALGAASHSAQAAHVAGVRALMQRVGVDEAALGCGAHAPVHVASAETLLRAGQRPAPIHNNCSGKHTVMLAAHAATRGDAPLSAYLDPASPLQRHIAALVAERTGETGLTWVTDGCGAPCFVLSLAGMARAWAQLASAFDADAPLGRIGRALHAEAWWMSGDGRLDLELVSAAMEPLVSKVGAAGVLCLALPRRGLGIALKVLSGSDAVRPLAAQALLERVAPGLVPAAPFAPHHLVRNVAGAVVGERRFDWS